MVARLGAHLLEQAYSVLLHEPLQLAFGHCLDRNVLFVAQNHDFAVRFFILVDFLNPESTHLFKADLVIECVDQNHCVGAPVVGRDDGAEGFGPSCIPDLHLDLLAFDFECLEFEVDSDGREQVLGEDIVYESEQERAFTNSRTTSDDDLVSLIVVFEHYLFLVIIITIINQSHKKYHRTLGYSNSQTKFEESYFSQRAVLFFRSDTLKGRQLCRKYIFLRLKNGGLSLKCPKGSFSLLLYVSIVDVDYRAVSACTMSGQCSKLSSLIPYRFWYTGNGTNLGPQLPYEVEQPHVCQPIASIFDPSCQYSDSLLIYHIKRVILSRARLIAICGHQLPPFELNVQVLASLSEDVDESQVVVHDPVFILPSKTENPLHFDLVSQARLQLIGMDDFVVGDFFVGFCLIFDGEDEGVDDIASGEGDEVELLAILLFFIDASADHESCSKEGGGVVLEADPAASAKPLPSFEAVDEEISVESFALFSFKTDSSDDNQIILVDFDSVETRREFGVLALALDLYPFSAFPVISMEQAQAFQSLLMISSEKVDLPFVAEESGVVSDRWEQGVEAPIQQRGQLDAHVQMTSLVSLHRWRLDQQLSFFLSFLEFGDLFLHEFFFIQSDFTLKVSAEGGVEFAMISIDCRSHVSLMKFHLIDYGRQAFVS